MISEKEKEEKDDKSMKNEEEKQYRRIFGPNEVISDVIKTFVIYSIFLWTFQHFYTYKPQNIYQNINIFIIGIVFYIIRTSFSIHNINKLFNLVKATQHASKTETSKLQTIIESALSSYVGTLLVSVFTIILCISMKIYYIHTKDLPINMYKEIALFYIWASVTLIRSNDIDKIIKMGLNAKIKNL